MYSRLTSPLLILILFTIANAADLFINEVMPGNVNALMDETNDFPESWVELYNSTDSPVNLEGWFLSDKSDNKTKWRIDTSIIIPGKKFQILYLDDRDSLNLHASFKLDIDGDKVFLIRNDGETIEDSLCFTKNVPNLSFGRQSDGSSVIGWLRNPTPKKTNGSYIIPADRISPEVKFSSKGGIYKTAVTLALSLPQNFSGLKIHYTLDGSEPYEKSPVYSGPISITKPTSIRAKVLDSSFLPRLSQTESYIIINRDLTLPVLSITTDSNYLFNPKTGIFVWGSNYANRFFPGIEDYNYRGISNLSQDWHRPMNMEYFAGTEHNQVINQIGEMKISGGSSKYEHEQKSFVVEADKRFGTKRFYYNFFRNKKSIEDGNGYKSLLVRNSGNDCTSAYMRDALIQCLYEGKTNVDCMAYQPAIVFINGRYWGIENIRERSNDDYILSNYNIDNNRIDLFSNYILQKGTYSAYGKLLDLLSSEFSYSELDNMIDIDNFIRYHVLQFFIWNADWPGNNHVFWRPQNDKFRWLLKDLDLGFGLYEGFESDTAANTISYMIMPEKVPDHATYDSSSTYAFRRIFQSRDQTLFQQFLDYYLITLGDLLEQNRIIGITDSLAANIRQEYPFHAERWSAFERYTPLKYIELLPLSPQMWEEELVYIKNWVVSRTRNVYDTLSSNYGFGKYMPLEISTSTGDINRIKMNSISVYYPEFKGKWPEGRKLYLSLQDSNNMYPVKFWEIRKIINCDTLDSEIINSPEIDLTGYISSLTTKLLVHAVLDKDFKKINSLQNRNKFSHTIKGKDFVLNMPITTESPVFVKLFNIQGKLLKSTMMKTRTLRMDISDISSQLIIVRIYAKNQNHSFQLLKKHN